MKWWKEGVLGSTLFQVASILRERAFCRYGKDYPEYRRLLKISCDADRGYYEMELTGEQREQLDHLLNSRSDASECELTLTYIAGFLDGIEFLRRLGLLDTYISDEDSESKRTKEEQGK